MSFYSDLRVQSLVNAATSFTVLGGSRMSPEVLDAMRDAAGAFVDMHELHERAGIALAELTNNEAAYVTAGCAAGIALAVLACRTGTDLERISRLPHHPELPGEVVIHAAHRNPYDTAVGLAGARLRTVGNVKQTFEWELAAALSDDTAAVLYVAGERMPSGSLPLADVVRISHAAGVPVIVDAAAQLPPSENLWRFTTELGADLALFSGGKELRGPQASGLMVGQTRLVAAARANGAPHQRLGRAMKVGKEEIAGLVTAVDRFMAIDHDAQSDEWYATCSHWQAALSSIAGLDCSIEPTNAAGAAAPRLRVDVDRSIHRRGVDILATSLRSGDPGVVVLAEGDRRFYLEPEALESHEIDLVTHRLIAELRESP